MEGSFFSHALLTLLIFLQFSTNVASNPESGNTNIEYIRASCSATSYRRLCFHSLSIYASKIRNNPKTLANTALNITLKAAKSTSRMMIKMSRIPGLIPRETAGAMADCIELIGDSIEELQDSIDELGHIRNSNFWLTMSDVQTWVSAALTDEDTCMDGLKGKPINGYTKTMLRRHILKVAHLTSNSLALINSYASSNPSSP
ncbi:21 kDa protein-like [Melia azedarach]|uniref:21 kDa protein-like n=1 Tax=Melia azedarach TaxID=155640 RepID=A0ACC1XMX4_MELAZ|nr:21 kDa protein-like [Melia azedarach]